MSEFSCSVVIPVFNKATTIGRAISSALAQSSPVDEIIVVNDGSSDSTAHVLEGYGDESRVRVITFAENRGVSQARNEGVCAARSEWIALLDADDYWEPDFIEALRISELDEYGLVGSGYRYMTGRGSLVARFPLAEVPISEVLDYFEWAVKGDLPYTCSSVIIRRKLLNQIGGFDSSLAMGEDQVLWARLLDKGKGAFVNSIKATYDLTGSSAVSDISHRLKSPAYLDVMVRMVETGLLMPTPYFKHYVRKVFRNYLIYQLAYLDSRSLKESLCDPKTSFLGIGEQLATRVAVGFPLVWRGSVLQMALKRLNKKWH